MDVVVAGESDIGVVREENEDSLAIHEPSDPEVRRTKGTLVLLADGMGGLEDGSAASRLAVESVVRAYYERKEPPRAALELAVKEANRAIFDHSQSTGSGKLMGSTITALALLDGTACVAQVGDSRAYCYRDGTLRQVTRDHSLVRELVDMGRIEEASPHYTFHRNVLTRGLGLREDVAVDLYELRDLDPGDQILLSTDGLHELVRPEEITACLVRFGPQVKAACKELVQLARSRGGPDNITVAIACVQGGARPATAPPEAPATASRRASSPLWILPLLIFGSFTGGVLLTLGVQAPGIDPESALRIRAEVRAALEHDEHAEPAAQRRAELRESLQRIESILDANK
jgi:serine/threonine protein phosphatase PrpC